MLLLIFGALFFLSPKRLFHAAAEADESDAVVWAMLETNAEFYEKDGDVFKPYTTLPKTYFVALLEEETESEYIKASYRDISGYVKKADLEITDYEPVTKYASAFFTAANEGLSAILRSSPDHNGDNTLALIPDGEKLLYYGTIDGSARYDGASTVWYYVKYEKEADQDPIFGYVYEYHGVADAIENNVIEKVPKPVPPEPEDPVVTPEKPKLGGVYETVFIVCLCIPAALIMFMLFRRAPQEKKKKKPRGYAD